MRNSFTFGGRSSKDFYLHVEKFPALKASARRRKGFYVPGRNGMLYHDENAFENHPQPYEVYFHSDIPAPQQAHKINSWLLHSGAYQKLQDTYDPLHYRMATFAGPLDVENTLNRYGRCVIEFDCAPQYYLVSGDYPVIYKESGSIWNPTLFPALPMVTVYGSGAGSVSFGSIEVQIHSIPDHLILDCERQNAYRKNKDGSVENCNGLIYAPEFPVIEAGNSIVQISGDIDRIEIIPRWWEL